MVALIEKNLKSNTVGATQVYKIHVPGTDQTLIGVGRALADGIDCSYICDVVHTS